MNTQDLDLTNCEQEPIRVPGAIQPLGALVVFDRVAQTILHASENLSSFFSIDWKEAIGEPLRAIIVDKNFERSVVSAWNSADRAEASGFIGRFQSASGRSFYVFAHHLNGRALLEFEEFSPSEEDAVFAHLSIARGLIADFESAASVDELLSIAVDRTRGFTGFDRSLVYQFNPDWHGTVVAENRNDTLPSYLGLHFPASDIPSQARELYATNPVRLIADVNYEAVPLSPAASHPVDLSRAFLRSVSPVHRQYMRNMDTAASMSISIMKDGSLWGLISCHNREPKRVSYPIRALCELTSRLLSMQLSAHEGKAAVSARLKTRSLLTRLLSSMATQGNFVLGLVKESKLLLEYVDASGFALIEGDRIQVFGNAPKIEAIASLQSWLRENAGQEVFETSKAGDLFAIGTNRTSEGAGILAVALSKIHHRYLLWFRPEVIKKVEWGGDPTKTSAEEGGSLQPRASFAKWVEEVRGIASPWSSDDLEAARTLRDAIIGIVLRQAEERAALSSELERSNKELEAFSYSVSHDLRAPFRHIVGYAELAKDLPEISESATATRYLELVLESARYSGKLVDNLLSFSQMGRSALAEDAVDLNRVVADVRRQLPESAQTDRIHWTVDALPTVTGDGMMLKLVFENLLSNAVKYSGMKNPAEINVAHREEATEYVVSVSDNGVGFDMQYSDKLFGVFQRLHRMEDFEGTGIGLANVKRVVTRHGGRVWAEGVQGKGATFYFTLPKSESIVQEEGKVR